MNRESGSVTSSDAPDAEIPSGAAAQRRPDTKEVHIRVSIPNYQYLDQLAIRYGIRSLSAAVNFLIEFHRQAQNSPTLGPATPATKQPE
jgi:hypothetical protein